MLFPAVYLCVILKAYVVLRKWFSNILIIKTRTHCEHGNKPYPLLRTVVLKNICKVIGYVLTTLTYLFLTGIYLLYRLFQKTAANSICIFLNELPYIFY